MKYIKENRSKAGIGLLLLLWSFTFSPQVVSAKGWDTITTSGVLTHNEMWSGRVHITGDIVIPEGITLVIQPGTIITFTPNSSDNDEELPVLEPVGDNGIAMLVQDRSNPAKIGNIFNNNT